MIVTYISLSFQIFVHVLIIFVTMLTMFISLCIIKQSIWQASLFLNSFFLESSDHIIFCSYYIAKCIYKDVPVCYNISGKKSDV